MHDKPAPRTPLDRMVKTLVSAVHRSRSLLTVVELGRRGVRKQPMLVIPPWVQVVEEPEVQQRAEPVRLAKATQVVRATQHSRMLPVVVAVRVLRAIAELKPVEPTPRHEAAQADEESNRAFREPQHIMAVVVVVVCMVRAVLVDLVRLLAPEERAEVVQVR